MVIDSGRKWLGIQWVKVTLYFHLREKIAKRLHHGLSDVREFKNLIPTADCLKLARQELRTKQSTNHCLLIARSMCSAFIQNVEKT